MSSNNDNNAGNNLWFHPVLLSLMEGRPVQEELAFQYIQENAASVAGQIKTLSENNLDIMAVQIAEWCMKVPALQMDVNVVSNLLSILNKLGRSEDFHRQCCQLPCCLAKEVMKVMELSSFQVARIASEIFLLQDLLNPSVSCCTKELLNFWLTAQKEENLSNELIIENVNKMLGIVEEFNTLCTFVEAIFSVFSSRFLPLCTDLSLRIFQSQKPLISSTNYLATPNCIRLVQTIEIIGKLFRNFTPLYSECLLTSLTLDPSLPRYVVTLNFFLGRTGGVPVSACKMLPVDIKVYNSVLQTVGQLRPIQLDRQQSWTHLRHAIILHMANNGYTLDPSGTTIIKTLNPPSDEGDLFRRLMVKEEQEANLMPATNTSAPSKFGMLQSPKPRNNAKPGVRRQAAVGRGQKKQQLGSGSQQQMATPSTVSNNVPNQISYQNYQYQSPESQYAAAVLPQVPIISGSSEMVPIVVDQDPVPAVQGFNQVQQVTTSLDSTNLKMTNCIVSLENVQDAPVCDQDRVVSSIKTSARGAKVTRTPSRTSPRRLQANPINANQKGIRYEDDNAEVPPISRRLRTRRLSETCDVKIANNKSEEGKKINSPRRGRPPKNRKTNGSCGSETDSPPAKGNPEAIISNGLKNFGIKKLKSISPNKSSFFNKNKYKKHSTQRHLWLKSRKKLLTSSGLVKGDASTLRKKRGKPTSMTELRNCFVSLSKLSSSEVIGKRASRKRKVEDSDIEVEEPPRKLGKKVSEKQKPKLTMADSCVKLQSQTSESAVKPCVCDGCGEVVPDCNWLTAHIVVCPGMTGAGAEEESENMMAPEETWTVEQTKLEQEQQPVVAQEEESFVQQPTFAEYPVQASENQTVTGHNFESFPSQGAYVIAPQNPISFGKEISVDGVSAFEFSLHRCGHCSLVFYTEISLDTHVKNCDHFYSTGTKYEVYVCSKCALHFSDKSTLWFHCQYSCGKSAPLSERETYKCWICQKEFLSELFLARHVLGKHASDSVAFQCLHQQLAQHKKQQLQYQVAKNPPNYSSLVAANGSTISVQNVQADQTVQSVVAGAGQNQLTTIDTSQISADFYQQATCELYQSSANLLYSQSDSYPQTGGQRIIAQSNGYFQQPQQQQEFSTVSVLPISMSEGQDVYYGVQTQSAVMNSTTRMQSQGDTFVSGSGGESTVVTVSTTPGGGGGAGGGMRRAAKGIMYKNVYMQCVVNYHCSHCKTDLSTKALKKEHRRSACFDANSNRFSYLRQYSYLCPYCGEKFPSQKVCRQHQLSVCLVLMGVKTDELNFKQHNCPFCNKKYFNVITLKGHLTLAHKDRVDSTDCGADADDGGNEDLIGGVGGKYSNLIVNNPLVPIPNLEAGPVFSSLGTSPLKVALQQHQQQLHQPQMISVVESQAPVEEESACMPVTQVIEPVVSESNSSTAPASQSTGSGVKSKGKKKSRGKSPVALQPAGSSLASTRSLRNNPRSSRYHYDDDFCSGEDLDVFEPKLSRSISEKSDRQTRSSSKVEDGKSGKLDCKNGESGSRNRHVAAEDDADSDATDDLTVDESAMEAPGSEGQRLSEGSNPFADMQNVEGRSDGARQSVETSGSSARSLFVDLTAPTVDQVLKDGIDPTAFIDQMSSTSHNLVYASTYASLQPLESDQATMNAQKSGQIQEAESNSASSTSRSSNNKFIIDNLLGHSTRGGDRRASDKDCVSDESDCQDDFLINIDSSLDAPIDEDDNSKSSGSSRSRPMEGPQTTNERTSKTEKLRSSKQEQSGNLFSATYEKMSRHDRRDESSQLANQVQLVDSCGLKLAAEIDSPVLGNRPVKEADEDSGRVHPGVVMDVKKRTILKKLSNSLNMASKRQPNAIGGAKFYK